MFLTISGKKFNDSDLSLFQIKDVVISSGIVSGFEYFIIPNTLESNTFYNSHSSIALKFNTLYSSSLIPVWFYEHVISLLTCAVFVVWLVASNKLFW